MTVVVSITEPQRRLLAAIGAHQQAPMRISGRGGTVNVGGVAFPLADLHVLRASKLVRRRVDLASLPAWLCAYEPTEAGGQNLNAVRPVAGRT